LDAGVNAGAHIWLSWLGFLLTGVGIPVVGLYANHLHQGDYMKLFSHLGKIPETILIGAIIFIIGPLFGAPRTETVTFASLRPFLPHTSWMHILVSALYFAFVFFIARKATTLVDIVGEILSPIKIIAFVGLIILGIAIAPHHPTFYHPAPHAFTYAAAVGYQTMDLFSAIFFGSIVYLNVIARSKTLSLSPKKTAALAARSSILGMLILALIYSGLMFVAHIHIHALMHMPPARLIEALASIVLGRYGAAFVAVCIGLACLATAAALAEVTTKYLQETVFRNKVPRIACLTISVVWMYVMSLLGFDGIMRILSPILDVIYPLIALYTLWSCIYLKWKQRSA
jgi:LIVCS family branched-chain amino acid:cation transporter